MPSKKKKYNARFPAGRIKKIMQSDEEIGKVAQAVPVIITLELFVESLLSKTLKITNSRNAKTLSTSHMKQCIIQEQRFDFLRELVKNIPDINVAEEAANYNENDEAGGQSSPEEQEQYPDSDTPYDLSMPSTSTRRAAAAAAAADQNGAATHAMHLRGATATPAPPHGFSINVVINEQTEEEHRAHLKRTAYAMQRVQQQQQQQQKNSMPAASNSSFGSSSVIMHTTKFAGSSGGADCPPPKLSRSESTPANQTNWQPHQQPSSRQRLKQQSLSIPAPLNINNNSSNNNAPAKSQPQQQLLLLPQSQTAAIPAPIVSYDFCNKPIVKIDYSNLPSATGAAAAAPAAGLIAAAAAPLSAPANIALAHPTGASAFNFSHAAPVINIDLSNIAVAATTSSLSLSAPAPTPPAAALPLLDPKASSSLSTSAMAAAAPFKPVNNNNNININLANKRYPAASNSSFFELDEDYDNI